MKTDSFVERTFTAPQQRVDRLTASVQRWIAPRPGLRVLEIVCGTGAQLLSLAQVYPQASLVGIDISPSNIEQAREACEQAGTTTCRFLVGDYLEKELELFDLILADSTLHLIEGPTNKLLVRLRSNLAPEGLLLCTTPDDSGYNQALWMMRRLLRLLRGPALDRFLFSLGSRLHAGDMPAELLRERIHYAYLLPHRYLGTELRRLLTRHGLQIVHEERWPHASLAQPRHRFCVVSVEGDAPKTVAGLLRNGR